MYSIRFIVVALVLSGVLMSGTSVWGAPAIVIVDRSRGNYEVLGQGLEDIRGIEMTITYDPERLKEPRIKQNSMIYGAMVIPDFSSPGVVRISISSADPHQGIKGDGSILMLSFTMPVGGKWIKAFSASVTSSSGADVPLPAAKILSAKTGRFRGDPFSESPDFVEDSSGQGASSQEPGSPEAAAETARQLSTARDDRATNESDRSGITAPHADPDGNPSAGIPKSPVATAAVPDQLETVELPSLPLASMPAAVPAQGSLEGGRQSRTNLLERFKEYSGLFTIQAVTALLAPSSSLRFRQSPPVALSDGATKVVVTLTLQSTAGQSPNFALVGARQVSLKRSGDGYLLELIPDKGGYEASLLVLLPSGVTEYPLAVAPPLPDGGRLDDASFTTFLTGYAQGKGDRNGDGRTDYRDLYLCTVNYLARRQGAMSAPPQPPSFQPPPQQAAPATTGVPQPAVRSRP